MLVEGVVAHRDRIDQLLAEHAEGWTVARMPAVDRNLLRIGVFELLWVDEIDDPVAITEAVELARTLSTDDSPRFLNGVLSRIADSPITCAPAADAGLTSRRLRDGAPLLALSARRGRRGARFVALSAGAGGDERHVEHHRFDSMTRLPWSGCVPPSSPWPSGRSRSA